MSPQDALAEILRQKRWVLHTPEKVPISALDGGPASSTNPATWAYWLQALAARKRYGLTGIGCVLGNGLVGVDVDHCVDDLGRMSAVGSMVMQRLRSYAELSIGEHGIHILLWGELAGGGRRRDGIEIYSDGRYFCMSFRPINLLPIGNRQAEVDALYAMLAAERPQMPATPRQPVSRDDQALIERACAASAKFATLWRGDWSAYDDGKEGQSRADLALCNLLAYWAANDPQRIDTLFRLSGLYRPEKWNRVHAGDGRTYGQMTIGKAIGAAEVAR